jgi:hypothetical protein
MKLITKNLRHQLEYVGSETDEGRTLAWLTREAAVKKGVAYEWATAYIEDGQIDFDMQLAAKPALTDDEIRLLVSSNARKIAFEYAAETGQFIKGLSK